MFYGAIETVDGSAWDILDWEGHRCVQYSIARAGNKLSLNGEATAFGHAFSETRTDIWVRYTFYGTLLIVLLTLILILFAVNQLSPSFLELPALLIIAVSSGLIAHYLSANVDLPRRRRLNTNRARFRILDGHHIPEILYFAAVGRILAVAPIPMWTTLPKWIMFPTLAIAGAYLYKSKPAFYKKNRIPEDSDLIFLSTWIILCISLLIPFYV